MSSNPTILITRPLEEAQGFAEALREAGFFCMMEPMLSILPLTSNLDTLPKRLQESWEAIILTSKQAVSLLAATTSIRTIPLLVVGASSAAKARELGFQKVEAANGSVESLIMLIIATYSATRSRFLYLSGEDVSTDLPEVLAGQNYDVERIAIYRAAPVQAFSDTLIHALTKKEIDAVSFFSVRTALTFNRLAEKHGLLDEVRWVDCLCYSRPVETACKALKWKKTHRADSPTQAAMLSLTKDLFYNQPI